MRAEVQLRRDVAGSGARWFRGEVSDGWLRLGWVVLTDGERFVSGPSGSGSWKREDGERWFPREAVARMNVKADEAEPADGSAG